ncbi:MAG TPA: protocatechuate 3,4-dioxygenase [Pusillimonas sp.]|uniref:protocatechuate 3,4-dioxygenase n=1 Tax=unclassified Pusillimonas TaxID=2640016 RepID=UPI002609CB95|nr:MULTISPECIES: protocatechuate 3,4-dioxygenase [unclassified Pusillimonas]HLU18963.1 protocatechuate 3,4-dioxygenase [Pusillimonas sp.]
MNPQLEGIEQIEGTYAFDIRTSNKALKLNRFFWNMIRAEWRDRYKADPEGVMQEAGLNETEKELVRKEDWLGLVQYGACFFVIEKFARVVRKTNLEVYAMMRGETFEQFMATRRVPESR